MNTKVIFKTGIVSFFILVLLLAPVFVISEIALPTNGDGSYECYGSTPDYCYGYCVDLYSDPWSCGSCDVQCDTDQTCEAGECVDMTCGDILETSSYLTRTTISDIPVLASISTDYFGCAQYVCNEVGDTIVPMRTYDGTSTTLCDSSGTSDCYCTGSCLSYSESNCGTGNNYYCPSGYCNTVTYAVPCDALIEDIVKPLNVNPDRYVYVSAVESFDALSTNDFFNQGFEGFAPLEPGDTYTCYTTATVCSSPSTICSGTCLRTPSPPQTGIDIGGTFYSCNAVTSDGICPDDFSEYGRCGVSGICSRNDILDRDCVLDKCGNRVVDDYMGEQCDDGELVRPGLLVNTDEDFTCNIYEGTCTRCSTTCQIRTVEGPRCGDNVINAGFGEECDGTVAADCAAFGLATKPGAPSSICTDDCKLNNTWCYEILGWTPLTSGWGLTAEGYLEVTGNGSNRLIIGEYFDMSADTDYELSASVWMQGCTNVYLYLNNSCFNSSSFNMTECAVPYDTLEFTTGTGWQTETNELSLPINSAAFNSRYFKDLRLRIIASCPAGGRAVISNISLKEISSQDIYYTYEDMPETPALSYSCCPSAYCWDGYTCMNSNLWMNNASRAPVWNSVISWNWNNSHVNISNQYQTVGYRCVMDSNGVADWRPASIKYDWNFEKSGYCANPTSCFANYTTDFDPARRDNTSSIGCVRDGGFIGNHYCHQGNWTTKTYIVANWMHQNLTSGNYRLHCYDDLSKMYNRDSGLASTILAGCVLSTPEAYEFAPNPPVITGIISRNVNDSVLVNTLVSTYNAERGTALVAQPSCVNGTDGTAVLDTGFARCIAGSAADGLHIYHNLYYDYFIVSTQSISSLETPTIFGTVWSAVVNFFRNIFGSATLKEQPREALSQTSSYDRIYFMKNNTVNVTAIEESKYDELTQAIMTTLYIRYDGTNLTNNPIYTSGIVETVTGGLTGERTFVYVNYSNSSRAQELIVKTDESTGLWQYFTSSLRII